MASQFWNPGDRETFYRVRGKGFFNLTIASVSRRSGSGIYLCVAKEVTSRRKTSYLERITTAEKGRGCRKRNYQAKEIIAF